MADEETQGTVDTSWWGFDDVADETSPSAGFDEPLEWPESLPWDDGSPTESALGQLPAPPDLDDPDRDLIFPPEPAQGDGDASQLDAQSRLDEQWQATGAESEADPDATMAHVEPLSGLGGGAGFPAPGHVTQPPPAAAGVTPSGERLPESIWSNDLRRDPDDPVGLSTLAFPAVYAEGEGNGGRPRGRRLDVRPGNAAVVALISVVSLVLLGMFLSVRARNDGVPTDSTQTRPPSNEIAATGSLNTIPPTTTATTTAPAPAVNILELLPPPEATDTTAATSGAGRATGTGASAPAAPAAPAARSSAPAATTATTAPAAEPAATTTATTVPTTTETTQPTTVTTPPVDDTTATTRRTTTSITFPPFSIPNDPRVSMPSIPNFPTPDSGR
jgi:hypothetical protein